MKKNLRDVIIESKYFDLFDDISPNIQLLPNELFVDLKTDLYPEILPIYKISNMNRIYNTVSQKIMSVKIKKNGNGYYSVKLRVNETEEPYRTQKTYSLHRLMMAVFNPVDNMEELVINHIDGNKENNSLENLEWCTISENAIHAYKTGLSKGLSGDDSPYSTLSSKEVHKICELYEKAELTIQEIADIIGVTKSVVVNIVTGNSWKSVSKLYDFSKRQFGKPSTRYSADEIHTFCKYFQDHKKNDNESRNKYLTNMVKELNYNNGEVNESLLHSLSGIYKRQYYKKINSQYTY